MAADADREPLFRRFQDVVGHEAVSAALSRAVAAGRAHHACLFSGPDGIGKRQIARAYATLLNCSDRVSRDEIAEACGRCHSCVLMRAGQHPDYVEVSPDGRFIKIDQIRSVQALTRFKPYEAAARVVVIDHADMMRVEGANALLKTLEEPSGNTHFVLLTSRPHLLLQTIRSRCQPIRFAPVAAGAIEKLLTQSGVASADASVISRIAQGSVARALTLTDADIFDLRELVLGALTGAGRAPLTEIMSMAVELGADRATIEASLDVASLLIRDALLQKASSTAADRLANVDLADRLAAWAASSSYDALFRVRDAVEKGRRRLASNVSPRVVAESMLLSAHRAMDESTTAAA